jgi:hypothetical protein
MEHMKMKIISICYGSMFWPFFRPYSGQHSYVGGTVIAQERWPEDGLKKVRNMFL